VVENQKSKKPKNVKVKSRSTTSILPKETNLPFLKNELG